MPGCRISSRKPTDWRKLANPLWLRLRIKLTGGLRLPNDETGDCQLFTQRLARMAEQAGVTFRYAPWKYCTKMIRFT